MLTRAQFLGSAALSAFAAACNRSGRLRIAVFPKATSHLFFVSIHGGVDKAAQDHEVDILWNGPSEETDHGRQIEIVPDR